MVNIRLATRVSAPLLNVIKPTILPYRPLAISQNVLTRSFMTSRVSFAQGETATDKKEDKPKRKTKSNDEHTSVDKKTSASPKKREQASKQSQKTEKIKITPNMKPPTSPPTPYFRFAMECNAKLPRGSTKEEMAERAKAHGIEWHALSESEKQPYYESYRIARELYLQKRQEWIDNVDPLVLQEINKQRIAKGKRRIKGKRVKQGRPTTPYMLFSNHLRAQQGEKLAVTEFARRCGQAWHALPEEEKQQYRDRFRSDMDAWRERKDAIVAQV